MMSPQTDPILDSYEQEACVIEHAYIARNIESVCLAAAKLLSVSLTEAITFGTAEFVNSIAISTATLGAT